MIDLNLAIFLKEKEFFSVTNECKEFQPYRDLTKPIVSLNACWKSLSVTFFQFILVFSKMYVYMVVRFSEI